MADFEQGPDLGLSTLKTLAVCLNNVPKLELVRLLQEEWN
jgi:hypothetical protein